MKSLIIGDVHGCLYELQELLAECRYVKGQDSVVLLGDLVDRGPKSAAVVHYARTEGFAMVLGNHDEKMLRYSKHLDKQALDPRYKIPMKFSEEKLRTLASLSPADIEYLSAAPTFIRISRPKQNFILVHGGLLPHGYPEQQDPKQIIRMRYLDPKTSKSMSMGPGFSQPEGSIFWADVWQGPELVMYGHNVHNLELPHATYDADGRVRTLGLDTGCCFGGKLTAAIIDKEGGWTIKQVKAHTHTIDYWQWVKKNKEEAE